MSLLASLPSILAVLNVCSFTLLVMALVAVRKGDVARHRRLMLMNLGLAAAFLVAYLTQVFVSGHERYPGEGGLRTLFLGILASHTVLAVSLLGLVPRTVFLALRERIDEHRRIARVTISAWLYVSLTGIVIYLMLHHLPTSL